MLCSRHLDLLPQSRHDVLTRTLFQVDHVGERGKHAISLRRVIDMKDDSTFNIGVPSARYLESVKGGVGSWMPLDDGQLCVMVKVTYLDDIAVGIGRRLPIVHFDNGRT